jgi:endonuclease/exonuclease/phosphatase family metal-dependent hydrolase
MSSHCTLNSILKVATFNIRVGVDSSLAQVASDCVHLHTDILCLQEIGNGWCMGKPINQTAYLASAQQHKYYHFNPALTDQIGGQFGIATTSLYPIQNIQSHALPCLEDEQRVCLHYDLNINHLNSKITILSTHLSIKNKERLLQAKFIANLLHTINNPVLVIGDLNDLESSAVLQTLYATGLQDAWSTFKSHTSIEEGYTFSTAQPNRRIDYLLYRGLACLEVIKRDDLVSSDHFPLCASFTLDHLS